MGARLLGSDSSVQPGRRLRELHDGRRKRRPAPGHLRAELQTPRRGEEEIRSEESLPGESEHPPRRLNRQVPPRPDRGAAGPNFPNRFLKDARLATLLKGCERYSPGYRCSRSSGSWTPLPISYLSPAQITGLSST